MEGERGVADNLRFLDVAVGCRKPDLLSSRLCRVTHPCLRALPVDSFPAFAAHEFSLSGALVWLLTCCFGLWAALQPQECPRVSMGSAPSVGRSCLWDQGCSQECPKVSIG